jgi:glycosyltransferase involved in cell wall biosynthesis
MATFMGSLLRSATRKAEDKLNILTFPTHERYQSNLSLTDHRFYLFRGPGIKDWNEQFAALPKNHILLEPEFIPPEIDFDLILSQNKFGQYQVASALAHRLHLPLISIEHTLPNPIWFENQIKQVSTMQGHINIFISKYSKEAWLWPNDKYAVITHGVDTNVFKPKNSSRTNYVLSVVNDLANRDWACGFNLWKSICRNNLPVRLVGANPGLSEPAANLQELVLEYQTAGVFLNTSLVSPVPTALLEAMACGCAVVSTATAAIPETIKHGESGLLSNDPTELRSYCEILLKDKKRAIALGEAARETIIKKHSLNKFVQNWNNIFCATTNVVYTGVLG